MKILEKAKNVSLLLLVINFIITGVAYPFDHKDALRLPMGRGAQRTAQGANLSSNGGLIGLEEVARELTKASRKNAIVVGVNRYGAVTYALKTEVDNATGNIEWKIAGKLSQVGQKTQIFIGNSHARNKAVIIDPGTKEKVIRQIFIQSFPENRKLTAAVDYADTGAFDQASRNKIFGISPEKVGILGMREEVLVALDLDAGLLNKPGARYYLWTGKELKYFVAKDVKRGDIVKTGIDPDLEPIKQNNAEASIIKEFTDATEVDFPFYIVSYIPNMLDENSDSFNINGHIAHLTRLSNMPVMTMGFMANNYRGIVWAKMLHEQVAFEAKEGGENGRKQHIAGLLEELKDLRSYLVKVKLQIREQRSAGNTDLVLLNIKRDAISEAIKEIQASLKQIRGIGGYIEWMRMANDYADTGIGASKMPLTREEQEQIYIIIYRLISPDIKTNMAALVGLYGAISDFNISGLNKLAKSLVEVKSDDFMRIKPEYGFKINKFMVNQAFEIVNAAIKEKSKTDIAATIQIDNRTINLSRTELKEFVRIYDTWFKPGGWGTVQIDLLLAIKIAPELSSEFELKAGKIELQFSSNGKDGTFERVQSILRQAQAQIGQTKIWEGLFNTRPWLNAAL